LRLLYAQRNIQKEQQEIEELSHCFLLTVHPKCF
jgi:hypothetical protein